MDVGAAGSSAKAFPGGFLLGAMAMRTIRTAKKGDKLLAKLRQGYSVSAACKAEKISRNAYYEWRKADPEFKQATDDAIDEGTDFLEDKARDRATSGESDTLLIFLLKGRRPEKYRERVDARVSGADGGPIRITGIEVPLPTATTSEDDE